MPSIKPRWMPSGARKLAFQVRDPSTRIAQADGQGRLHSRRTREAGRGGGDLAEHTASEIEVDPQQETGRHAHPPREEFHFELRRNRISYIDLTQLMEKTKADAQLRIRMADRYGSVASKVGPVGSFSLAYELVPAMPNNVEEMMDRRNIRRFDLKGWKLVPEYDNRGETFEGTQNPISEYTRAVNRINKERATITLWVYPDSFALYRQIATTWSSPVGFSVAARPLPMGLAIRGSPMGTQSACSSRASMDDLRLGQRLLELLDPGLRDARPRQEQDVELVEVGEMVEAAIGNLRRIEGYAPHLGQPFEVRQSGVGHCRV